jgi:hypothetical protein
MLRVAAPTLIILLAQAARQAAPPAAPRSPYPDWNAVRSILHAQAAPQAGPPGALSPFPDWNAVRATLDRDYDACLAPDQRAMILLEFAPSGKLVVVEGDGALAGSPLAKCVARVLKGATIPPFSWPKNVKTRKLVERTDCVVVAVRSDQPVPVRFDGKPVGTTPVDVRTKRGEHVVEYTTTNGFTQTRAVHGDECGRRVLGLRHWIDPAEMVPSPSSGP